MKIRLKKRTLFNLVALSIAILVFIFVMEIALSLFYPQPINKLVYQQTNWVHYHPLYGWMNTPNNTWHTIKCHKRITMSWNSQGWRDTRDYSFENPSNKTRVLVLGDSFMFGEGLDDSQTYSTHLQNELGPDYEVLNLGVTGYGTGQEYMILRDFGLKYNPDIVVLGFFQNDPTNVAWTTVSDDPERGTKPAFRIAPNGSLVVVNCCPVPRAPERFDRKSPSFLRSFHSYVFFQDSFNNLKSLMNREKISFYRSYTDNEYVELRDWGAHGGKYAYLHEAWLITTRLLDEMHKLAQENGFRFIILDIPTHTQYGPKIREEFFSRYNDISESDFQKDKLNRMLEAYAESRSIDYINLLPVFETEGNTGNKYNDFFFSCDKDMHWSSAGAKQGAFETAKYIKTIYS